MARATLLISGKNFFPDKMSLKEKNSSLHFSYYLCYQLKRALSWFFIVYGMIFALND